MHFGGGGSCPPVAESQAIRFFIQLMFLNLAAI